MECGPALILVATPIGNVGDLAPRAVEELAAAEVIACEDSRRTGRLLALAGISGKELVVVNEHTEAEAAPPLVARIRAGERVVLVTDAGTPAVADPGERLVRAAAEAGCAVSIVPGPSAPLAAVAVSGLTSGRFVYEGFLPRRGAARAERLAELATSERAVVLLEAPHRCARTAADLAESFGSERRVVAVRELTKLHEEIWRGSLGELAAWAAAGLRGEVVLVIEGAPQAGPPTDEDIAEALAEARAAAPDASVRDITSAVAGTLGVGRRRVYEQARKLEGI
ncbi:MAG: 16S rRNA (cytidine(1402)-2'-O)-methyltransferase [bacterium]|nr:16S rRNA (cytidine(1402)-2'-O)-methyltransferase [bacterium]MXV91643.1 16S rRNA (cytidine(1402)-2'-O)-methyltransferase [Acidimicrobiia bacterium]MYC44093.1 16S rRNA (cytidine(1402)-2'-O)-methyltransferase [Acidimicrobiia bacterium]MYI18781.1 16S rRNA (cytidine(1402)-2'-O)-methyltransferase [Acidimicrobiia bacterium]